jgi:hypothetical protein
VCHQSVSTWPILTFKCQLLIFYQPTLQNGKRLTISL